MTTLLITLHVLICIALIAIVLLQGGKGAEIGASFGAGASQTVFGASGGKSFMTKLTASAALIFMLTSLTLTYYYGRGVTSVMPETVVPPAPQVELPERLAPIPGDLPATPAPAEPEKN
jgi:preprotein translocase subunit SecG